MSDRAVELLPPGPLGLPNWPQFKEDWGWYVALGTMGTFIGISGGIITTVIITSAAKVDDKTRNDKLLPVGTAVGGLIGLYLGLYLTRKAQIAEAY
jgi:hypothetical protein